MKIQSNRLVRYILDSYAEMKKVTWPTPKETVRITIAVIAISLVVAAFLGAIDFSLTETIQKVLTR